MRIADKMGYDQVTGNLSRNRAELADLQNQAATQKRVNRPSDDPLAAARVLGMRSDISGNVQYLKSVNSAKSFLEYSEQSLSELSEGLLRAKELAVSQSNDASANANTRAVAGTEIGQLRNQAVQVGNRKLGERYLFGGFKTTRPPFDPQGGYRGDDGEMEISIGKDAKIAMNIPGSRAFLGRNLRGDNSAPRVVLPNALGTEQESTTADDEAAKSPAAYSPPSQMRGPASVAQQAVKSEAARAPLSNQPWTDQGVDVFQVLRQLEISLKTNDKGGVQASLDQIDDAISQIVLARSELGARVGALNSGLESLQKNQVDSKTLASSLEDADTFELVSDLNKTESTLKATLETSGKLIQPSLLDFIK